MRTPRMAGATARPERAPCPLCGQLVRLDRRGQPPYQHTLGNRHRNAVTAANQRTKDVLALDVIRRAHAIVVDFVARGDSDVDTYRLRLDLENLIDRLERTTR